MQFSPSSFWLPLESGDADPASPLAPGMLEHWEQTHHLKIPLLLRQAYIMQNGGTLNDSADPAIVLEPIEQWESLAKKDFLDSPPHSAASCIAFAWSEYQRIYFLDYSQPGPDGEPQVGFHDGTSPLTLAVLESGASPQATAFSEAQRKHLSREPLAAWLARQMSTSPAPAIHLGVLPSATMMLHCQIKDSTEVHEEWLAWDTQGFLLHLQRLTAPGQDQWTLQKASLKSGARYIHLAPDRWHEQPCYRLDLRWKHDAEEWNALLLPRGVWKNHGPQHTDLLMMYSPELEPLILLWEYLDPDPADSAAGRAAACRRALLRRIATWPPSAREAVFTYLSRIDDFEVEPLDDQVDESLPSDLKDASQMANSFMSRMLKAGHWIHRAWDAANGMLGRGVETLPSWVKREVERLARLEKAANGVEA